jgi:hypothetical protein
MRLETRVLQTRHKATASAKRPIRNFCRTPFGWTQVKMPLAIGAIKYSLLFLPQLHLLGTSELIMVKLRNMEEDH